MRRRLDQILPILLLAGHLLLLSSHEQSRGSAVEVALLGVVTPLVDTGSTAFDSLRGFVDSLKLSSSLREENRELRRETAAMRREMVRLQGVEEELERLSRLSRAGTFQRFAQRGLFVADVVYVDNASWLRTLIVDTGEQRARRNQPAVTAQGLVGRVVITSGSHAKILLLTDRSASASAMLEGSRRRGVVRGNGEDLILDHIPALAEVRAGERVVTAGIDGVFPRGVVIGTVTSVEPGSGLFHRIHVRPAIDFSLLEQVFVLTDEIVPSNIRNAEPSTPESAEIPPVGATGGDSGSGETPADTPGADP